MPVMHEEIDQAIVVVSQRTESSKPLSGRLIAHETEACSWFQ